MKTYVIMGDKWGHAGLMSVMIACLGCIRTEVDLPDVATNKVPAADRRILICEDPIYDFGKSGESIQKTSFRLWNVSSREAIISRIGTSCGCTAVSIARQTIPPNSFADVDVVVDINKGRTRQTRVTNFQADVLLHVVGSEDAVERLVMKGVYLPPVIFDQVPSQQTMGSDRGFSYSVALQFDQHRSARVLGIQFISPIDASVEIEGRSFSEERYQVSEITVSGTIPHDAPLPMTGNLILWTNMPEVPEIAVPIVIREEESNRIKASPDTIAFGVRQSGERAKHRVVVSWPSDTGITLASVASTLPASLSIETDLLRVRSERQHLLLRCVLNTESLSGAVDGSIQINFSGKDETSVPALFSIPFTGFVKDAF
jgi:hypothetical protein